MRVRFNRDQDMMITGKRHPFLAKFRVGFDGDGLLLAAQIALYSNGGWSLDLSRAVTDRALFHLDNAYYIPHVEFSGRVAKTNLASNTAFRGFGGPQGMLVIEEIIDRIARRLGLPPEVVRERNLYRGNGETNTTHYGQEIEDNRIQRVWRELKAKFERFRQAPRRKLRRWNTAILTSQARARDHAGEVRHFLHHHASQPGGRARADLPGRHGAGESRRHGNGPGRSHEHRDDRGEGTRRHVDRVRVMPTSTDKVPNTSATAASCGTDLNGAAVKNACDTLRARLLPFAEEMLSRKSGTMAPVDKIVFNDNMLLNVDDPQTAISFAELLQRAYFARTSLSAIADGRDLVGRAGTCA